MPSFPQSSGRNGNTKEPNNANAGKQAKRGGLHDPSMQSIACIEQGVVAIGAVHDRQAFLCRETVLAFFDARPSIAAV
jgi:hypothetical protein